MEWAAARDVLRVRRIATQASRLASESRVPDRRERSCERFRVWMRGLVEHRFGGALLDDPARIHDRDPVGDLDEHGEVVRDEEHRESELPLEPLQQLEHLGLNHHIERGGGLVRDHERRVARQSHRDHHPLLLPAGELVGVIVDAPSG